jgi:hypothetical protein
MIHETYIAPLPLLCVPASNPSGHITRWGVQVKQLVDEILQIMYI